MNIFENVHLWPVYYGKNFLCKKQRIFIEVAYPIKIFLHQKSSFAL
jgi:hypothetical protein